MSTSIRSSYRPRSDPSVPASPSSYATRHSTIGAKTFLFDWPELASADRNSKRNNNSTNANTDMDWSTLPTRLHQLVQHFLQHPHLALTESRSITMYPSRRTKYKYKYDNNDEKQDNDDSDEIADAMEARRIALTAAMVDSCPTHVWNCFEALFAHIIRVHIKLYAAKNKLDHSNSNDVSVSMETDDDDDEEESFTLPFDEEELYQNLHILQWLNPHNPSQTDILTRSLHQALHDTINDYVSDKITGIYNQPNLYKQLILWKSNVLTPLLQRITHTSTSISDGDGDGDGDGPYEALLHQTTSLNATAPSAPLKYSI